MAAFFTSDPGESHMKITAIQIFIDYSHYICPPESISGCIHIVPSPFQIFKVIFNTFVVCTCLGVTGLVNIKFMCCCLGHW